MEQSTILVVGKEKSPFAIFSKTHLQLNENSFEIELYSNNVFKPQCKSKFQMSCSSS